MKKVFNVANLKKAGMGLQIIGAVGALVMAGFDMADGINGLKNLCSSDKDITDSVASTVENVEA